jgi:hypothetical protein
MWHPLGRPLDRAYTDGNALGVEGTYADGNALGKALTRAYGTLYADGIALGIWWPRFFFCCNFAILPAANTQKYI